jgi:leucyl aminopeptidase
MLKFVSSFAQRPSSDVLVVPFWEGKKAQPASSMKIDFLDFHGKEGETLFLYKKQPKEPRLLLLGLGKKEECTQETVRKSYAAAVKACRKKKLTKISVALPKIDFSAAPPAAEGLLLSNYAFDQLKSKSEETLIEHICLIGADDIDECKRAEVIIEAVNFARDLVNGNADDVTPQMLAKTAKNLEKESKAIKTTVFDKKGIEKLGMGLLLAVNRGSHREPAFIVMEYKGDPSSSDVTAIVGKGITYDTGGLCLKPPTGMETMKDDMSGGAAVLGTIKAAAALKLKVNLLGAIASTENAIGPASYKPGDVYKSYSGKTVEIGDTDAEGRLVLADAVSYVQDKYKPKVLIDLATLTGGILVALGDEASGIFSNDEELARSLIAAGKETHERLWAFPMYPEYKEPLKSLIADLRNIGLPRKASSSTGAIFIQEFINKTPWAHLDIAGTAYLSAPRHYHPTKATGVGVRLLIEYLTNVQKI